LILVDGAFCSRTMGPSTPLSLLLAPHFSMFTYDRRGRGPSGDSAAYAVEREIEDPTLVIGGQKSPDNLRRGVQATVNLVRNSGFRELPGQTHNVSVKVLAPVLEAFFSGTAGG
jgi:hypothetical protein